MVDTPGAEAPLSPDITHVNPADERTWMGHDEDGGPRDRASVREGSAPELPDLEISSICEHPNARAIRPPPAS